jgi:hypothetical protein
MLLAMRANRVAVGALILVTAVGGSVWLTRRSAKAPAPNDAPPRAADLGRPERDLHEAEIAEDAARAFVEAWAGAFNRHEFTAFSALYDPAFESLDVAAHHETLKYDQWMADRERLIERKARLWVACLDVEPTPDGGGYIAVSFDETLRVGEALEWKRQVLRLARRGSGLAIVAEDVTRAPLGVLDKDTQRYAQQLHPNLSRASELPVISSAIDENESAIAVLLFFPEHEELSLLRRADDGTLDVVARSSRLHECKDEVRWVEADGERAIELSSEGQDEVQEKSLFAPEGPRLVRVATYERFDPPCSAGCEPRVRPLLHAPRRADGTTGWRVEVREVPIKEACPAGCGD